MHSNECIPLSYLIPTPHGFLPIEGEMPIGQRGSSSYSALSVKRLKSVTVRSLSMFFKY